MPSEFSKGPRNIFRNIFVYIFHLSSKGKRLACLLKKNSVKLNCVRISSTHSFFYYLYKNNLFLFASKSSENTILFELQYQNWGLWEFVTANYSICKVKAICPNGVLILYSVQYVQCTYIDRQTVRKIVQTTGMQYTIYCTQTGNPTERHSIPHELFKDIPHDLYGSS